MTQARSIVGLLAELTSSRSRRWP